MSCYYSFYAFNNGIIICRLYDVEKLYKLEDNFTFKSTYTQVFIINSSLIQFKRVINILESNNVVSVESESTASLGLVKYHIIVIPKRLASFDMLLEEFGLYGKVEVHSFMWQFIYLDQGLISMELPNLFSDIYVNKDLSLLTSIGKSLYFLFDVVGKPEVMIAMGKHSQDVYKHIEFFEENLGPSGKIDSDFGAVLIMDRSVDYTSALLTDVTYTGLLGEIYKISGGVVEQRFANSETVSDCDSSASVTEQKSKSVFALDNKNDSVYLEIKNRHILEVSDILGMIARQLKAESQPSQDMALSEIKTYVQTKLQSVTSKSKFLNYHLHACEKIISELGVTFETLQFTERSFMDNTNKSTNISNIEDYIITGNYLMSLRLLCLISLTQTLSWDEFNSLKLQYLHQNGYNLLYIFQNLLSAGLLLQPTKQTISLPIGSKKEFYSLASKLKLIPQTPEKLNVRSPTCPSYVFGSNYIPIITQILNFLFQAQTSNDIVAKLDLVNGTLKTGGTGKLFPLQQKTVLVFILGGITYAEIAACNLLEKLCGCKIVLASDCLISGNDLMEQCLK